MRHSLATNSVILDTESLGLRRGEGLHELAVYDLDTDAVQEFVLKPHRVVIKSPIAQEQTKLATSVLDSARFERAAEWVQVIASNFKDQGFDPTAKDIIQELHRVSPWMAEAVTKHPHLLGRTESNSALDARKVAMGVKSFASSTIDPTEVSSKLKALTTGKTIWGANIGFDAKQIGAVLAAAADEGIASDFKQQLETFGPTKDPLYVTGVEVNRARVVAAQTGDWTGVWKAYKAHTPTGNATAVRDIQDVLRSVMSYGQKLGLLEGKDVNWGTSLDLVHRLMKSMDDPSALTLKESHRAAEDAAIHSKYILNRVLSFADTLESVYDGTNVGKDLIAQAKRGTGELYHVANYLERLQNVKPLVDRIAVTKRLQRAATDIIEGGATYQTDGFSGVSHLTQSTAAGGTVHVPVNKTHRVKFDTLEATAEFIKKTGKYSSDIDIDSEVQAISGLISNTNGAGAKVSALNSWAHNRTSRALEDYFAANAQQILGTTSTKISKLTPTIASATIGAIPSGTGSRAMLGLAAGGVALATAGAIWSSLPTRKEQPNPSIVSYNYQQWLAHQQKFFGMDSGDHENGIGAQQRHQMTDFGSPYQGIVGSNLVFADQEILQERERYLRAQYGVRHFDPDIGLFGKNSVFARARHQGYTFLPGGEKVANGYAGLKGDKLLKVNLGTGNWKLSVDDADTVTLKKGGLRGAVASLFGMNQGYSFRLAGVDAPETYHEGKYGGAQPHAYESLAGLQSMINQSENLELVYNPSESTYGRGLGALVSGSQNLNYELVKRGLTGHLPFGKPRDSMIDYSVLKGLEKRSADSNRGMWVHPYWQAMYDVTSASHQRMTFNTLTQPSKIVESQSTMDTLALMQAAEAGGEYTPLQVAEASRIGKFTHMGGDQLGPSVTGSSTAFYSSYLHEQLSDTNNWIKSHGSRQKQNRISVRSGYGKLDKALVLDSMGNTTSVWAKRRLNVMDQYGSNLERKYKMMLEQQRVNNTLFDNQINHQRMQ